jgi:hypothetical protein
MLDILQLSSILAFYLVALGTGENCAYLRFMNPYDSSPPSPSPTKEWADLRRASEMYGLSRTMLFRLRRAGQIVTKRPGKKRLVYLPSLQRYLDSLKD